MYLGNQPALAYTSFAKQDFTTSATTSYTLDNPVANANELALFINFVRQEPTTAYSASGTSLTLTSATTSSDDMYCVYLGKAVQTVNPPNASVGLSQLTATGTKDSTTFLRGDNTFAVAGGDNTPAFFATLSSNQSVTSATTTKVQFNTEVVDTDGNYDNSTNYRFTPTTAGKYFVFVQIESNFSGGYGDDFQVFIYKNGSQLLRGRYVQQSAADNGFYNTILVNGIVDMNGSSDYVEGFGKYDGSSPFFSGGDYRTYFGAYKLIGV